MGFLEELQHLRERVPHPAILMVNAENSAYCPYHANAKNSYMLIGHNYAEDCYYGFWVGFSRDCVDCAFTEKSEFCYMCIDCRESYDCNFCQDCISCASCWYCYDCKGCMDCFGCVNLRNKKYYIFNEAYDKETYQEKIKELKGNKKLMEERFSELKFKNPHVSMQGYQNENVLGDHIFHGKNVYYSFDVNEIEDGYYLFNCAYEKDCMDTCYSSKSELLYMCMSAVSIFDSNFCSVCWYSQNLEYCEHVFNSHDCFGCISRNHAEYEILNKKYSKDEYFKKVLEIKQQLKADGLYGKWWFPSQYPELQPTPAYMGLQYFK